MLVALVRGVGGEVDQRQVEARWIENELVGLAAPGGPEDRPQGLVPLHERPQRALQRVDVQSAVQPQRAHGVERRRFGLPLLEEPEPEL